MMFHCLQIVYLLTKINILREKNKYKAIQYQVILLYLIVNVGRKLHHLRDEILTDFAIENHQIVNVEIRGSVVRIPALANETLVAFELGAWPIQPACCVQVAIRVDVGVEVDVRERKDDMCPFGNGYLLHAVEKSRLVVVPVDLDKRVARGKQREAGDDVVRAAETRATID